MEEVLLQIIENLNLVEVHGENNLILLGSSIDTLIQIANSSVIKDPVIKEVYLSSEKETI